MTWRVSIRAAAEAQRFARVKAENSSKSVILQARSLSTTKSELPAKYAQRG